MLSVGRRYFDKNFVLLVTRAYREEPKARLCVIASKKVGNAPTRNLVKRRMRELFRLESICQNSLPIDLVLIGKASLADSSFEVAQARFKKLLSMALDEYESLPCAQPMESHMSVPPPQSKRVVAS
jgi:ribonuclease P protein component